MPYFIQDRCTGLYVENGPGFTDDAKEAATFTTYEQAMEWRNEFLRELGERSEQWDLRVRVARVVGD